MQGLKVAPSTVLCFPHIVDERNGIEWGNQLTVHHESLPELISEANETDTKALVTAPRDFNESPRLAI